MGKPPRYSYRVVIQQEVESFERGTEFGPRDGWGEVIREKLDRYLHCAELIAVTPIRNLPHNKPKTR